MFDFLIFIVKKTKSHVSINKINLYSTLCKETQLKVFKSYPKTDILGSLKVLTYVQCHVYYQQVQYHLV